MQPTVRARVSGPARPHRLTLVFLATLLVGSPRIGLAQSDEELKDLSLGELLDLEVTAATKTRGFSTRKAPSVIRVFTRRDLDQFAFQTIRDVLANVPGIQVQEYRGAHQAPWIRGVKSRYNNKILWLIDGVPLRDSYYGHSSIDEILPLDMVERIEIISGPGSVLYGANAFAGVVSIVTRKAQDVGKGERAARASFGSYDTAEAAGEFAKKNVYSAS
jgi:outer membrane receptor for ferrienterochelin and colicin